MQTADLLEVVIFSTCFQLLCTLPHMKICQLRYSSKLCLICVQVSVVMKRLNNISAYFDSCSRLGGRYMDRWKEAVTPIHQEHLRNDGTTRYWYRESQRRQILACIRLCRK